MNKRFLEILFARYAKFYCNLSLYDTYLSIAYDLKCSGLFTDELNTCLLEILQYHKENQ